MAVHYTLSWGDPHDHHFDVRVRFTAAQDDPLLWLPAWRPGRYLIQNYAANVRECSANLRKVGKTEWLASARAGEEITVGYRYFAGVLDAGSSFLDDEEAWFNGSNLFMCVDSLRGTPIYLSIAAPAEWRIETQLPLAEEDGALPRSTSEPHSSVIFSARNYDHLIDSPVVAAAEMTRYSFVEDGARIHLVFRNDQSLDTEDLVEPVRRIVRAQSALFGALPFPEYRFLYHVTDRWHGVEHEDSSSITIKRNAMLGARPGDEGHDHFLSITSHELFHVWNVKRMMPAVFAPYHYLRETPTRLLWAMEGLTSYYGDLSLVRAGLWSAGRYLKHLAGEIETLENSPGRRHLSLAQASFDGWLQDPSQMHDKANAWISFYNKGEIVGAMLDLAIRIRTAHSLDDVMRYLWTVYGAQRRGMEEDALECAVGAVTGEDFTDFFARYVSGTEPLPYEELFAAAGIGVVRTESEKPVLGAGLRRGDRGLIIETVTAGAAAARAGLLPGDELIAVDGNRTTADSDLESVMRGLKSDHAVELLASRAGVVQRRTLLALADPRVRIALREDGENPLRAQWLREVK